LTHESLVQTLLSLHCALEVQQGVMGVFWHWLLTHESLVQTLLSLHWAFDVQQGVMGVF
jgi:hypothetical protein